MGLIDNAKIAWNTAKIVGTIAGSAAGQPQAPIEQAGQYQKTQNAQRELQVTKNQTTSGSK